jgi:hypothetical protein
MDPIENSSPNSSSVVASRGYRMDIVENIIPVTLYGHYLATAIVHRVVTEQRVYTLQYHYNYYYY